MGPMAAAASGGTIGARSNARRTPPLAAERLFGLLLEVRPLPMMGAMLVVLLGARASDRPLAGIDIVLYALSVMLLLYVAHLRDSIVDWFTRPSPHDSEQGGWWDHGGRLTHAQLSLALVVVLLLLATVVGALMLVRQATPWLLVPILFGLLLALIYSPHLDTNPLSITIAYPAGIVAAFVGALLLDGSVSMAEAKMATALSSPTSSTSRRMPSWRSGRLVGSLARRPPPGWDCCSW